MDVEYLKQRISALEKENQKLTKRNEFLEGLLGEPSKKKTVKKTALDKYPACKIPISNSIKNYSD